MNDDQNAPMAAAPKSPSTLETVCNSHRALLKTIEDDCRKIAADPDTQPGEAKAQAMLTVRHLEDARMRLGKVIQYAVGGGVSCWDSDRKPADDGR